MKMDGTQFEIYYSVYHNYRLFAPNRGPPLVPVCATAIAPQRQRSTSLQLAKKKQHDRVRMTAFMNKKDAQNLPFYNLEDDQLQYLRFNSLLSFKKCKPTCKKTLTELEKKISAQDNCISFLRTENADLKVTNNVQSEKCLKQSIENDRITEKSKDQIQKQKKRISELEIQCERIQERLETDISLDEELKFCEECELRRLRSVNKSFEQTVNSVSTTIDEIYHMDSLPGVVEEKCKSFLKNMLLHLGLRERRFQIKNVDLLISSTPGDSVRQLNFALDFNAAVREGIFTLM